MARRTKEDAQRTRDRILDMAEREFLRRGVSRTSLEQIASAAGVTRGAVYWHFRNKADLFNAMMNRVTLPLEAEILRSGERTLDDPVARHWPEFAAEGKGGIAGFAKGGADVTLTEIGPTKVSIRCMFSGRDAKIVFGVRTRPFSAHCWVESEQEVLLDLTGQFASYVVICRL